jgi:hypothetical protein
MNILVEIDAIIKRDEGDEELARPGGILDPRKSIGKSPASAATTPGQASFSPEDRERSLVPEVAPASRQSRVIDSRIHAERWSKSHRPDSRSWVSEE